MTALLLYYDTSIYTIIVFQNFFFKVFVNNDDEDEMITNACIHVDNVFYMLTVYFVYKLV